MISEDQKVPKVGEIWKHSRFGVRVEVKYAGDLDKDIFARVKVKPLDGGSIQELTILDFLDNGFVIA